MLYSSFEVRAATRDGSRSRLTLLDWGMKQILHFPEGLCSIS